LVLETGARLRLQFAEKTDAGLTIFSPPEVTKSSRKESFIWYSVSKKKRKKNKRKKQVARKRKRSHPKNSLTISLIN